MQIIMIAPAPFFADRGCHTRVLGSISTPQRRGYRIKLVTYGIGREIDCVETIRCFNLIWLIPYYVLYGGSTGVSLAPYAVIVVWITVRVMTAGKEDHNLKA